ncbi:MAG: OmpA family protein, partial [Endomicrobiia bacterium]|nr:OmpA family protein [Endomicrobiia bacterium]
IYYNPAGLAFMYSPEIYISHATLLTEDKLSAFGYSFPTDAGTFAMALDYLSGPEIFGVSEGVAGKPFSYYTGAGNFGYALRFGDSSGFGVTLRHAIDTIESSVENFTGADAGFLLRSRDEVFSLGGSATNLGISGSAGTATMDRIYRGGFSFKWSLPEHYSDIILAAGYSQVQGKKPVYSAAVEHIGAKVLGLRVGYEYPVDDYRRTAHDPLSFFHAGASLRFSNFQLNYAYKPLASLGDSHRIDLQWRLYGWGLRKKKMPARLKIDPRVFSPNSDGAKDNVFLIPEVTTLKRIDAWELKITSGAAEIRKYTDRETPPKIIVWDGKDSRGDTVYEGVYRVIFTAEDKHRMAISDDKTVTVDITPPEASLRSATTIFMPSPDGLGETATFYATMRDPNSIDLWQIVITNFRGKSVKLFRSTASATIGAADSGATWWAWDGRDDHYETAVPPGEYTATLTAVDPGGNRTSSSLNVRAAQRVEVVVREVVREVEVADGPRGLVMTLASHVLFESGKSEIKPYAKRALDEVMEILKTYPENNVLIEGYTDSVGSSHRNRILSSKRAWGVYSYLVRNGVDSSRLTVKGLGQENPRASDGTASGRAMNRRVEIIIQKKEAPSKSSLKPLVAESTAAATGAAIGAASGAAAILSPDTTLPPTNGTPVRAPPTISPQNTPE